MSYSSIIQKDLPLATWELEETPTSGGIIACDKFLGSSYNGSYTVGTVQTEKKSPIIFGSTKSVQITANNGGYAFQIPSLDRLSLKSKSQPFSIEFWIKFYSQSFASPTSITKIMGKPNSQTGIYIHNSSIIAIVGDTAGSVVKTSVSVPNIKKPLHIVMSFVNNTVSLSVNGQRSTKYETYDVINKAYSSSDEYFRFIYPGSGLEYSIDQISIYSRVLNLGTIRRHIAYGLGYEMPNQVARFYGGYRYNMSMVQTPIAGKYEKGDNFSWANPASISNMTVENGYLRIKDCKQPFYRYATDKTSSVFSWDATEGLKCAAGGYIEIPYLESIGQTGNYGFGSLFYKSSAETKLTTGQEMTLIYLDNQTSFERYVRFYLVGTSAGENLAVQIDNNTPVVLLSNASGKLSGLFSCGFYYSSSSQELTVFAGYNTTTGVTGTRFSTTSNSTFYPGSMRLFSSPAYTNSESYSLSVPSSEDKRFIGGVQRITHLSSLPSTSSFTTIQSAVSSTINNYAAEADSTSKRFIMKAAGSYSFNVDLKRLAGSNRDIVGNHRIEWGSNSQEITITALGKGYGGEDGWLSSTTLSNNSSIGTLIDESPGTSKYLNLVINVSANDIEDNPTKIYYFRIVSYPTTFASSLYTTTIVSDGPDINVNSTAALPNALPSNTETPFLFDEEQGGLYVAKTAVIPYSVSPISVAGSTAGLRGISFFINLSSSTTRVFTITDGTTTYNLTYNGTAFTNTGMTCYVDGTATSTITPNVWHHVVLTFGTRLIVSSATNLTITFGVPSTGTANFYLDEIMTLDGDSSISSTEVTRINNLYKGASISIIGDYATNEISVFDNESYVGSNIYQPLNNSVSYITPVNFVTNSVPGTYTTAEDIFIDGQILQAGDRILVPSSGIYTVNTLSIGSSIVGSASNPANSTVLVTEGNIGAGKYYRRTNGDWYETTAVEKIRSYAKVGIITKVDATATVFYNGYTTPPPAKSVQTS